ncbi:MAG: zf-HC2 domain-containing protein [Anaeromyxobacter sp.]
MTTDNHILPLIDAYLAGGLDDAEMRTFDAHVAACGDCAAAVDAARAADAKLVAALADAVPDAAYEDRLIGALRPQYSRPSLIMRLSRPIRHPMVRRIAVGVAASLVIGTVGYGMSVAVESQSANSGGIDPDIAGEARTLARRVSEEHENVASRGDRDARNSGG